MILVALLIAGTGAYLYLKPTKVMVPNVVGMSRSEAEEALRGVKLQIDLKREVSDDPEVKPEEVLRQTPEAQTSVPQGSVVTLYVADKPVGIELPNVAGKTRSEAEDILRRLGLDVVFEEKSSNRVEIGKVISQEPKAGPSSLKKGDKVTLTISGGRGEQTVPELIELNPDSPK